MRKQMGLSQEELSSLLDANRTTLSMHELGTRSLPPEAISKFFSLYNKTLEEKPQLQPTLQLPFYENVKRAQVLRLQLEEENKLALLEHKLKDLLLEKQELETTLTLLTLEKNGQGINHGLDEEFQLKRIELKEKLMEITLEVEVNLLVEMEKVRRAIETLVDML